MNDVLEPICRRYAVNLVTGAGELSMSAVIAFFATGERADQPARILYVSDFDPAGLDMPISIARKVEYYQRERDFGDLDIRLEPIVLTTEQVEGYRLPRVPVEDSDRRKANFEAAHGAGQVDSDALEALHPGELAQIVTRAILNYSIPTCNSGPTKRASGCESSLPKSGPRPCPKAIRQIVTWSKPTISDCMPTLPKRGAASAALVSGFQSEIDAYRDRLRDVVDVVEIVTSE